MPSLAQLWQTNIRRPTSAEGNTGHETTPAYTAGRCRCQACRDAVAAYQRQRRARLGHPGGKRGTREFDLHISRDWFRYHIWLPAQKKAGLDKVRFHDLRHAHASWLLAGGASLQVIKERLGHASITTPEHSLPDEDESAIEAFQRVRGRR